MVPSFVRPLALISLLTWTAPAEAAASAPATTAPSEDVLDFDPEKDPPRCAPADLELWRRGRQATFDVLSSRREASRLQRHIRGQRLKERLTDLAASRPEAEAKPLLALRDRLTSGWSQNYDIMARRWPVDPTRGCGYPWLTFDSALRAAATGSTRADVVTARKALETCVGAAGAAIQAMQASNAALAPVVAEAEKALGGAPQAAAPAARPGHEAHEAHEQRERAEEKRERGTHKD